VGAHALRPQARHLVQLFDRRLRGDRSGLQGGAHGDEPKYLRYAENFYQGLGFDHSAIKPIADLPADFRPRVWRNFALLADVVPQELQNLGSDARRFARDPWRRFNRARFRDGGFLDGKDGGAYQVHNPGVSMMMPPCGSTNSSRCVVV